MTLLRAFICQLAAFLLTFLIAKGLPIFHHPVVFLIVQSGAAMSFSVLLRQQKWWLPIHLLFLPCVFIFFTFAIPAWIYFEPDPEIFKEGIVFDFNRVISHMRQQAYLVKGLRITAIDAREVTEKFPDKEIFYFSELGIEAPSQSFCFEGGLLSLVKFYNQFQKPIHKNVFYIEKKAGGVVVLTLF